MTRREALLLRPSCVSKQAKTSGSKGEVSFGGVWEWVGRCVCVGV
jgi:hypothetical protein